MRSPKVEEWDIRAVETGDILKPVQLLRCVEINYL